MLLLLQQQLTGMQPLTLICVCLRSDMGAAALLAVCLVGKIPKQQRPFMLSTFTQQFFFTVKLLLYNSSVDD
jgi:hypothetical protein